MYSAVKAAPRCIDAVTDIDGYGWKNFGSRGFATHIALSAMKQSGISAAIFLLR